MVPNHQRDFFGAIFDVVAMNSRFKSRIPMELLWVLLQSNRQVVWLAFPVMGGKNDCFNHTFTIFSRQFPEIFPFPSTKQHGFGCALTWHSELKAATLVGFSGVPIFGSFLVSTQEIETWLPGANQ
jgi:hypothetical protein